jgi:hypothetical protein
MTRHLVRITLLSGLVLAPLASLRAEDAVILRADPSKRLSGTLVSESPSGVRMKIKGETTLYPAGDILDVIYDFSSGFKLDYNRALGDEKKIPTAKDRKKAIAEALSEFEKLLPRLKGEKFASIRRNIEYKIAYLTVELAQEKGTSLAPGIKKFQEFKKTHAGGWQIIPAAQMLGQLLVANGKFDVAEEVYNDLAGNNKLPKDARDTFKLLAAKLSMQPGKYDKALAQLQELAGRFPKGSRQLLKAQMYQAECLAGLNKLAEAQEKLKAILSEAKNDKDLRAQAYNTLGHCHEVAKDYKGALWDYLRVDVVYYQNREEHARALYHLVDLFKKLKDTSRSEECRAKLKGKEFAGTEYQTRFLKEGKGS